MGATWRPWVNDSDAPANGEASNNAIEVARNWRRCIDLEFIGEAERGARSAQSDSFILSSSAKSTATRRGTAKFIEQGLLEYSPIQEAIRWIGLDQLSPEW